MIIRDKATSNGTKSEKDKTFYANCTKCHNSSEPIADPKNNTQKLNLSPHYVTDTRLLARFGIAADLSKPYDHDDILASTCDNCHSKTHGGKRSGQCLDGCHSVEQILYTKDATETTAGSGILTLQSNTVHDLQTWAPGCKTCHSKADMPTDHIVPKKSCSTTGCHSDMAAHVVANAGKCFTGCHSSAQILNAQWPSGDSAHGHVSFFANGNCSTCHATSTASSQQRTFNNGGMCYGCHARKGEIKGNAGKNYQGKDWYGAATLNAQEADWTSHSYGSDNTKTYVSHSYTNSSGTTIGTATYDEEATFDDMYTLKDGGHSSGDGTGSDADRAASVEMNNALETSGHQPNRKKDTWTASISTLKTHVKDNLDSIRCSECHNSHNTDTGKMGIHNEWPTTQKKLPGKTDGVATYNGSTVYTDNTMPAAAIASDGTRLITLNDYWSRAELIDDVKAAMLFYYEAPTTDGGLGLSTDSATKKYDRADYDGITADDIRTAVAVTGATHTTALATQWERTTDIFCFRCHDEAGMKTNAHSSVAGTYFGGNKDAHKKASLACVSCHTVSVHGSKMPHLFTDAGAYDDNGDGTANNAGHTAMNKSQEFRWTTYQHNGGNPSGYFDTSKIGAVNTTPKVIAQNAPVAQLYSFNAANYVKTESEYVNYSGCSTSTGCHHKTSGIESWTVTSYQGEQLGSGWQNWTTAN